MSETEKLRRGGYDALYRRVAGLLAAEYAQVVGPAPLAAYNATARDPHALALLDEARRAVLSGAVIPPHVAEQLDAMASRRTRHLLGL